MESKGGTQEVNKNKKNIENIPKKYPFRVDIHEINWITAIAIILVGCFILVIGIIKSVNLYYMSTAALVFALGVILSMFADSRAEQIRIYLEYGKITLVGQETINTYRWYDLKEPNIKQSKLGKRLNYGHVKLETKDGKIVLDQKYIYKPRMMRIEYYRGYARRLGADGKQK